MAGSTVMVCCLLYFIGCKTSGGKRIDVDRPVPAKRADAIVLKDATIRFVERLNKAACDIVYSDASEAFRLRMSDDNWPRACEELRSNFGPWENSIIRSTMVWPGSLGYAEGTSTFSGNPGRFLVTWSLENGRARLYALSLEESNRRYMVLPEGLPGRFLDPPPPALPISKPLRDRQERRS
jgi:hypothetical protein